MQLIRLAATIAFASLVLGGVPASGTVNYGDFAGSGVDFLDVSETTQSPGDPNTLWAAPSLGGSGDQLLFFPPDFTAQCVPPGGSDTTSSILSTTIEAQPGGHIDNLALAESGDVSLTQFPPFGTPDTNASANASGTLTVLETTSGPIAPVVIPFSGVFSPAAAFALPGDFGTNTWSGTIFIDVAAVVPNATVVELALDNTLDANCAAGTGSAKIQKKVVSGPTVAIMVNPVQCDLELDKTCCVTQPALPDLGQCEGDLVYLDMEFTGDKCSKSDNDQGGAFRCHGRRKIGDPADVTILKHASTVSATPDTDVDHGDIVRFESSDGTLKNKTKFKVKGPWWRKQHLQIDTSCERAIQCGDQFGAFEVTGFESTLGGVVDCNGPPPPPVCAVSGDPVGTPCDAKLVDMVLEYNGRDCQNPLPNPQSGEASCSGDATGATNVGVVYNGHFPWKQKVSPASDINDGDRVRVTSTWRGGLFPNQSFLITDDSGIRQEVEFHVSCSKPLALGDEFGSFKLVEFTTKNGTRAALGSGDDGPADSCEVPLVPPTPHCTSDLEEITLVYIGDFLGEGCTTSNSQSGYATCSGVDDPGDPVSVNPGSGLEVAPDDQIEFGDLVTLTPTSGDDLPTFTSLDVTGAGGSQSISFKTSCHKPLNLGDRFGSFVVFGMVREEEGPITLGGNVQYQYTVRNPNAETVDNVVIDDSELGEIASGFSLDPNEVAVFTQGATLFGTTTNIATANGDILGDMCTEASDSVTVDVVIPPQGAFNCGCWQSLNELTLIWDGTAIIDVKVWDGAPGGTLLEVIEDVAPGYAVTTSGFTADEVTFEIFDMSGTTKLGESEFELTCRDKAMNGVEDCGKNQGDGKWNDGGLINDWLLEGMVDDDETLSCSPTSVPPPPSCGFGPELLLVMPGLLWLHRRRLRTRSA